MARRKTRGRTRGDESRSSVVASARAYLRAITGGLLVGLPLLVTMEVWEAGATLPSWKVLVVFVVGYLIVVGFNALSGFRQERTFRELVIDATQGMGLSVVVAAFALAVLGRLDPSLAPSVIVGRVALEAIPVAFGMSLAATLLGGGANSDSNGSSDDRPEKGDPPVGSLGRLLVAAGGALYFALNVAPTDEVRILAANASSWLLIVIVLVSLLTSLAIVFHAEFRGGRSRPPGGRHPSLLRDPLDSPLGETLAAYALSLLVSALLLWSFGVADGAGPRAIVGQVVVLAFIGSFGAAGARLLVGGGSDEDDAEAAPA